MRTAYDAIVVGGGHNGLVAGFYLARAGLSVLIVERRSTVGGLCAPIEFFPGYRGSITNTPSALEPKIQSDLRLLELGVVYDRPDPTVVFPAEDGRAFRGWRDPDHARAEIARFSEADVEAYAEIIDFFNSLARRLRISVFEPPPSLAELVANLRTPQDEADFGDVFFGNIKDFLDQRLESPVLKALLASLSVSAGNVGPSTPGSPLGLLRRPLSLFSADSQDDDPRKHFVRGSTGLARGGMGSIAEAMERAALGVGCEILRETAVREIAVDDHGVSGIVTGDGVEVHAPIVLSNLNPKTTMLDLVGEKHLRPDVAAALRGLKMNGGAFKLVLAMDGVPRHASAQGDAEVLQLASCQFRYSPTVEYLELAYDDYKYGRPSARPKLLGLTPSLSDPTMTPPGRHLMSVNVWYAPYHLAEGTWDAAQTDAFARQCIATIGEFIPNIAEIVTDYRCYSPLDFEQEFGLVEGHQLHGDMTPIGMFGFRPTRLLNGYRTPVAGLYLCGSGTWPGGTVTGIPGHNAAHAALVDRILRPRVLTEGAAAGIDLPHAG